MRWTKSLEKFFRKSFGQFWFSQNFRASLFVASLDLVYLAHHRCDEILLNVHSILFFFLPSPFVPQRWHAKACPTTRGNVRSARWWFVVRFHFQWENDFDSFREESVGDPPPFKEKDEEELAQNTSSSEEACQEACRACAGRFDAGQLLNHGEN